MTIELRYISLDTLAPITEDEIRASFYPSILPLDLTDMLPELGYAELEFDPEPELAAGESLQPGALRREGDRVIQGWEVVPAPEITPSHLFVDAERDRRISAGFTFQGVRYQSRLPAGNQPGDWDVFSGKALEALIAIMAGAQPGDLRWSDPAADFAWIAADNTRVPMDAQTVIELGKAAAAHRSAHTFAGSDLKAMAPIPADYTADHWWPAEV